MHSATDHGYNVNWTIQVDTRLNFLHVSAEGAAWLQVFKKHRDFGYWECVFLDGPRQGSILVRSESDILKDCYAD